MINKAVYCVDKKAACEFDDDMKALRTSIKSLAPLVANDRSVTKELEAYSRASSFKGFIVTFKIPEIGFWQC